MLLNYKSPEKLTPFAAEWEFNFFQVKLENKECISKMITTILEKEPEIIKKYPELSNDGGTSLGPNSLTSKFSKYNLFTWEEDCFIEFQNFVREQHSNFLKELNIPEEQLYVGCWANVLRHGQRITPHWHVTGPTSYLGAHMCLTGQDTSTIYSNPFIPHSLFNSWYKDCDFKFKNESGNLLFFPDWMIHYTTPYTGNKERITIAMDIVTAAAMDVFTELTENYSRFN